MTNKYRCNHCATIFTAGDIRDCCLEASVSEQERLKSKISKLEKQLTDLRIQALRGKPGGDFLNGLFG